MPVMNKYLLMVSNDKDLVYRIALTLIPGIGHTNAKKLISWAGELEALFKESREQLLKIPGMGRILREGVNFGELLDRAESEVEFLRNSKITPLYFYDDNYPENLRHCADSPLMLYFKGNEDFRKKKILAVVGTRHATAYGKRICEEIIDDFSGENMLIVSGMAYGIDSCAHARALSGGMNTVGVLAHGLDRIYPHANRNMARRMLEQGGLLTEFLSKTNPDRENFPKRNRIIAGMADAVLVIESATKGGAMITADIANSYNRDVFTVPGRISDEFSDGCHLLIRRNIAALVRSAADIRYSMGWDCKAERKKNENALLEKYAPEEQKVLKIILEKVKASVDDIVLISGLGASKTASILLRLEFDGVISGLPGKMYEVRK